MNEDEKNNDVITEPVESGLPKNDPEGESVTPEEVAELLGLPSVKSDESSDEEDEDKDEDAEESADDDSEDDDANEESDVEDSEDAEEESDEGKDTPPEITDSEEKQFVLEVEDANGKKFTLKPGDDLEKVLDDFEPKSNGQIFSILQQMQKLETDKANYDKDQEVKASEEAKAERVKKVREGWDKEIKNLQGQKRLPVESDGKSSDRLKEVFKFINEENEKRLKDGRPLLESLEDALDKLELRESKDETAKKAKEEKENARKKGAIVGGSSAPSTGNTPVYKPGARNASEALRMLGIIK